jgi:5-methylcytosine-specific restriction endonuclease McrA
MAARSTTNRDRHRRIIAKDQPPCHWCHQPINYQAGHLDPLSFQVDHVTPIARGGEDVLDNCVPSHRACNRQKSDKVAYHPGVTYVTDRKWW